MKTRITKTIFGYITPRTRPSTTLKLPLESRNDLHAVRREFIMGRNGGEMPSIPTPSFNQWLQSS